MKKAFLIAAALMAINAQADYFESAGLYFTTTGENTVAVDRKPDAERVTNPYKGVCLVPEQVFYNGANYTVTAIADRAFFQSKITELQIPNSVTTIGVGAFAYAEQLANITLPLHLSAVSKLMLAGAPVVNVAVPEGVENIGWGAFQSCPQLHTMLLPSTTKTIEAYGYNNCHNLYEIYSAAATPPSASGWAIFIGLTGIDVIVPSETALSAYKANSVWGNEETFTLYPSEDISISLSNEVEKYNDQYARLALGNNLAYKIFREGEQIALTAADYYYVPIEDHAVTYTIVPTDMMHDADAFDVVIGQTPVRDVIADYNTPIVYGHNGTLFIKGDTQGQRISVYDISGRICHSGTSTGDEVIDLNPGHVYIVLVGNYAKKVFL